ncbi:Uncharacterised protein [Klebsiella quasipneumoniae]|nr:hypothetical protein WP5W18E06_15480 [Klebsiella quasipneumoniae]VGG45295.1 Uncharacterised protein [Klebsiella quasipneumoniae]
MSICWLIRNVQLLKGSGYHARRLMLHKGEKVSYLLGIFPL